MENLKKRICFVVSSSMTINAFLQQPIKLLSKHFDIYVALNFDERDSLNGLESAVTILPVGIKRNISLLQDLLALWQLTWLFYKYRFSIVHSVTPKAGLLAMLAAAIARIDIRIHTFTGQVWATKTGFARLVLKSLDKLIACLSTNILVDSPSQRQFLLDEDVVNLHNSGVLLKGSISGVDLQKFKPNDEARSRIRPSLSMADNDVVFLFIGRLNRDKGVLDLAQAFSIVAHKHTNVRLLIVGVDEANLTEEIKSITLGYENKVSFVGFTALPQEYMTASDVLCLPSYREGFGNVVIEAAAVGVPTIGSNIYGISDAVMDDQTGKLFEVGNISALESCMVALAQDIKLRNALGKAAHKRAVEEFSSQKLSDAWLQYYQELS